MDMSKSALLKDLWEAYQLQITAMKKSLSDGQEMAASLHSRMAEHLLETYFDAIEKVIIDEPR